MAIPFAIPKDWQRLQIVLIEADAANTVLLRSALEYVGADVEFHQPGSPQALLNLLHRPDSEGGLLILDGHGTEDGLCVPELHHSLRHPQLANITDVLPTNILAQYLSLAGWDVINLCCMGGTREMIDAFRQAGVSNYIGADGYPDGNAAGLFAVHMVDALARSRRSFEEAWSIAASYEEEALMFVLSAPGGEKRHRNEI